MDQVASTGRLDGKAVAALYSVLVNVVLIGAKLLVGLLTGSVAILADAAHSFLDLSASIFAYAGIRTAAKPADEANQPASNPSTKNLKPTGTS